MTTDEEINRYIHEEILGLCSSCQFAMHSTHEDECVPFGSMPDYCNDLNLAAKAEAKVIERVGFSHYYEALRSGVTQSMCQSPALARFRYQGSLETSVENGWSVENQFKRNNARNS